MAPRYRIQLTGEKRGFLDGITRRGKHDPRIVILSRVLLLCDCGEFGPAWESDDIVKALEVSDRTIERLKMRCTEEGIEAAIKRRPKENPSRPIQFDGAFEARLLTLACSEAPNGRERWTVRLLAEKVVELIQKVIPHFAGGLHKFDLCGNREKPPFVSCSVRAREAFPNEEYKLMPHKVGVQVSRGLCPQVSTQRVVWKN